MKAKARHLNFSIMIFVVMTSSEHVTFDIIGRHFTANMSMRQFCNMRQIFLCFCYHLDYMAI